MNTNTLDLISIHMVMLSHQVKGDVVQSINILVATLRKGAIVGVTCWEFKSHLFKALVLPTFTHGTEIWGGDLKNSLGRILGKA